MIHCVSPLSAGILMVNDMPAHIDNREIKKITGVIPQEISLDVDLTVYENLMVFSRFFDIPRPQARQRISELLKFVELETKKKNKINQLSTGMKKDC
jgi:lipooligosaccharide transport system ATP-binding protein